MQGSLAIAFEGRISHVGMDKKKTPFMKLSGRLLCGEGVQARFEYNEIKLIQKTDAERPN